MAQSLSIDIKQQKHAMLTNDTHYKIITPCSRLSTAAGSHSIMHTEKHKKLMWPWLLTDVPEIQYSACGCRASRVFALFHNGNESRNPVVWPSPLTYDLDSWLVGFLSTKCSILIYWLTYLLTYLLTDVRRNPVNHHPSQTKTVFNSLVRWHKLGNVQKRVCIT